MAPEAINARSQTPSRPVLLFSSITSLVSSIPWSAWCRVWGLFASVELYLPLAHFTSTPPLPSSGTHRPGTFSSVLSRFLVLLVFSHCSGVPFSPPFWTTRPRIIHFIAGVPRVFEQNSVLFWVSKPNLTNQLFFAR